MAFGEAVQTIYDFSAADVVLSLDADFLNFGPAHLRYARDFMARRRGAIQQPTSETQNASPANGSATTNKGMNRLYVVECCPSATGAVADHRLPTRAQDVEQFARVLAAELSGALRLPNSASGTVPSSSEGRSTSEQTRRWVAAVAKDLITHRGTSMVIAGPGQPAAVHALAHAMNDALGNVGRTVTYIAQVEARPTDQTAELAMLAREMEAGEVEMLLILGGNPVFNAPADLGFAKHLPNVPLRVCLSLYQDETAAQCDWHIPQAHFLESWGDARAYDGTISIQQPLIAPLYNGHSVHEVLSGLFDAAEQPGYEIVRGYWRNHWPQTGTGDNFDLLWEKALHDGLIADTALPPRTNLQLRPNWIADLPQPAAEDHGALEITFQPDPTIYDGRFANNGWLQELPKPVT